MRDCSPAMSVILRAHPGITQPSCAIDPGTLATSQYTQLWIPRLQGRSSAYSSIKIYTELEFTKVHIYNTNYRAQTHIHNTQWIRK